MSFDPNRRNFIKTSLGVGIGIIGTEVGCGPSVEYVDFTEVCADKPPSKREMAEGAVQKGPFVQFLDATTARLRFETRIDETTKVQVTRNEKTTLERPDRIAEDLQYQSSDLSAIPDRLGDHVLHTLLIKDLQPSEKIAYAIMQKAGEPICGTFTAPPPSRTAFRLGWIADTMVPGLEQSAAQLSKSAPDIVVHGGDITYDVNPFDSWNQFFAIVQPLLREAPIHFNVGNHEYEAMHEVVMQYDRLFEGQGAASHAGSEGPDPQINAYGRPKRYHSFRYGGALFICLDTESRIPEDEDYVDGILIEEEPRGVRELYADDSVQLQWLDDQLAQAQQNPDVQHIIVSFHRPMFSWSKYGARGETTEQRALLHQRFLDAGVSVVMCGHAHCFEFFEVDGLPYVVDGGGGALLVNPDESKDEILVERPEEEDLRLFADKSYGITTIDFAADGAFTIQRFKANADDAPQFEKHYPAG